METFKIVSVSLGAAISLIMLVGHTRGEEATKKTLSKDVHIYVDKGTVVRASVCIPSVEKMKQISAYGLPTELSLLCDRKFPLTPQVTELIAQWGSVKQLTIAVPSGDRHYHWLKSLEVLGNVNTLDFSIGGDSVPILDELAQMNLKVSLLKITFITSTVSEDSLSKLMNNKFIEKATVQGNNILPETLKISESLSKRLTISVMKHD